MRARLDPWGGREPGAVQDQPRTTELPGPPRGAGGQDLPPLDDDAIKKTPDSRGPVLFSAWGHRSVTPRASPSVRTPTLDRRGTVVTVAAQEKREQKRQGRAGSGWLRSACGSKVVRITTIDPTAHAQWCEVVNADLASDGQIQAFHNSRMLRYNAVRLWQNLLRQGWTQVPAQW
ncbi:MAG: DUF1651 domain-containing protein [Synechococcaceae bacterium WB7_3xG_012]|nr:DUF1651 domain-containing protein [Synechococcaceae bacterium WB7_3xG_012]